MLGQSGMRAYAVQLRNILEQLMNPDLAGAALPPQLKGMPIPVLSRFLTSAYLGVLEWWLDRRSPHSPEDMARWLGTLSFFLVNPPTASPQVPRGR
jgi:hypothetical protein